MPYVKKKNNYKWLLLSGIIFTVLAMIAVGLFAWHIYRENQETRKRLIEEATPRIVVPMEYFAQTNCEKSLPSEVKAVTVHPGEDFYTDPKADEKTVSAQIDTVLEQVKKLSMNSILVDTRMGSQVIFSSDTLQSAPVDALKLFCQKAEKQNIAVSAVFHTVGVNTSSGEMIKSHLIPQNRSLLCTAVSKLSEYPIQTIELTDYYVQRNGENFSKYVSYGDFGDYGLWLKKSVRVIIEDLCEAANHTKPDLPVGIQVSSVWANASAQPDGSNTKASFQSLTDGYADTKSLVEDQTVDFVNVNIETPLIHQAVPFKTAASWWGSLCKKSKVPMYITHAGEKACTSEAGWNGTDELARQVSAAVKIDGYQGSVFSGLSKLSANPSGSTDNLVRYLKGIYPDKELNTDLTISLPTKRNFVTYDERQQFRMKFDPNQEVLLDGVKVVPTERGGASIWKELKVGNNTFTLKHKGKTTTFNIERRVIIFQSVSPTKDMKVAGSSTIEFNVMAYKGSSVAATLNGKTVKLEEGGAGEDNVIDSAYVNFTGSYTVPKATAKEQKIGRIVFKGSYQGFPPQTKNGAFITVDKRPDEVDPDKMTGQVYTHAVVSDDYANTYPYFTTPKYPQGILYQLPEGTEDVILSESGNFLNLRSGITVHRSEVNLVNKAFVGNNHVSKIQMGIENNDTVLRLTMGWKAPFSISLSPYPSNPTSGTGYQFVGNTVTILLDYTTTIDNNISGSFDGSPIFSGSPKMQRVKSDVTGIYQYKLTLPLNKQGRYYGCHAEWEGNTLVLRFNNPPANGTLEGMRICVDAGHGGSDNGTMAGSDTLEKDVNMIMGEKVASVLQSLGAEVIMTRSDDTYVSLQNRVKIANQYKVDMLIACHHNSAGWNAAPTGVETYYNAPFSQPLAYYVQQQLAQYMSNRGAKGPEPSYNFYVTREKQFTSILIEFGFLSNPNDEALALDEAHQDSMAAAVGQGVLDYFAAYN